VSPEEHHKPNAALSGRSAGEFDAGSKQAVEDLIGRRHGAPQSLLQPWRDILAADPATREFIALSDCDHYDDFAVKLAECAGRQAIDDSLFLAGLRHLLVPDAVFERFLAHLRRFLLEDEGVVVPLAVATAVAAALAVYCHYTGYVFDLTDAERKAAHALRLQVENADELASHRHRICVLACYEPIDSHLRAHEIVAIFGEDPVLGFMTTELVVKPKTEARIAASVEPLADIEDESSRRIQRQYVEFPYPRWRAVEVDMTPVSRYVAEVRRTDLDILVAGCGTGLEALCYRIAFPSARILAVDLSQASLAYAIRQTAEYGPHGITFRQADILQLPGLLDRKFDIVSSSGVLHHMKDPEQGFDALRTLVKPGGSMFLCLYSALGRRHLVKAQQAVAAHAYPGTAEGVRAFRSDCTGLLAEEDLAGIRRTSDFFTMAHCHDLLFNAIEHRFDVPRLKALLERGGVDFAGFAVGEAVRQRYAEMFPGDPDARDLDNWERFEVAYPDTFFEMYKFICRA